MALQKPTDIASETTCFHCGDKIRDDGIRHDGRAFCCAGCKVVYALLQEGNLSEYYTLDHAPGHTSTFSQDKRFSYLDDPTVVPKLRDFTDGTTSTATFDIPQMHCSSCIWLLERLYTLDPGILHSRTDFLKKQIRIRFNESATSLRRVVELLASLGYEPQINLASVDKPTTAAGSNSLYYRIGIAGFCFGNIMLLSFPEYLASADVDAQLRAVFSILNILLSLPVIFYSASGYFLAAWAGLRERMVNIELPLAFGISILFARSLFEILVLGHPGYLDSMSGLVLLLLTGKLFQSKTYDRLNFERDYRSYFPLAVTTASNGEERVVPVSNIRPGDRIILRNNEIAPADAILLKGHASIDYSFVTGESRPVDVEPGTLVYAGGRQVGRAVEVEVIREVSRSYLTQLWNDSTGRAKGSRAVSAIADRAGKFFTLGVLVLAAIAAVLWFPSNPARAWDAITAILIVACPCAIALSTPFTFGTTSRIFGRNGLFLKDSGVVESMAGINTVVFDKTGTLTHAGGSAIKFVGEPLNEWEASALFSLARNSHHPLSRAISEEFDQSAIIAVDRFCEEPGRGLGGTFNGTEIRLGSKEYAGNASPEPAVFTGGVAADATRVFLSINGRVRGHFVLSSRYREGLDALLAELQTQYRLYLVSGDSPAEREHLAKQFPGMLDFRFRQSPADKLSFVRFLQRQKRRVLMVGDGLNDAGALRQSDVGIAFTEDISAFSPACDAILEGKAFSSLGKLLRLAGDSVRVVLASFAISLVYNGVGLYFAFRGELSPLVAAILMPLSSITVVAFTTLTVRFLARKRGLR
jgi:P-type Cu+ transporter